MPERQGKVHVEKKIVLRVSTTKEEIVVTIESVIIGIFHIANTSRKTHVKWDRIVHAYTSKKKNSTEKLTVAIVNNANHLTEDYCREALTDPNFHEQPLEFRGKPPANKKIQNAHERHYCA